MPEISIVVPIYNAEKYLDKCLNSLVKQTFQNIEILAFNDGSVDRCKDILCEYKERYPDKIRVFEQENIGISRTRNRGIQEAKGKYIAFIDSDDSVDVTFCERLYKKIEQDGLDVVVCDYYEVASESRKTIHFESCGNSTVYEKPELLYRINTSPWNKLYNRKFLVDNGIDFPVGLKYEDVVFMQKIFARGARIGSVGVPLVYYVIHPGSESTVVKKNVFDIFHILDKVCEEYEKGEKEDYQRIYTYLEQFVINRITVYNLQQIYQEEEELVNEFIEKGFIYLDHHFPEWRKNAVFLQENSFLKRIIKKHIFCTKTVVKLIRKNKLGV